MQAKMAEFVKLINPESTHKGLQHLFKQKIPGKSAPTHRTLAHLCSPQIGCAYTFACLQGHLLPEFCQDEFIDLINRHIENMSPEEDAHVVNLIIGKRPFFDTAAYSDTTHAAVYTHVLKALQDLLTQLLLSINVARPECCQNNSCTGCRDLSVPEITNGAWQLSLVAIVLTLHHVCNVRVNCVSNGGGTQVQKTLEKFELLAMEFDHQPHSVAADGLHLTLAVVTRGQNPKDAVKLLPCLQQSLSTNTRAAGR